MKLKCNFDFKFKNPPTLVLACSGSTRTREGMSWEMRLECVSHCLGLDASPFAPPVLRLREDSHESSVRDSPEEGAVVTCTPTENPATVRTSPGAVSRPNLTHGLPD